MRYLFLLGFLLPYRSLTLDLSGMSIPNYYFLLPFLLYNLMQQSRGVKKELFFILIFPFFLIILYFFKILYQDISALGGTGINLIFNFIFVFLLAIYASANKDDFVWLIKKLVFMNISYAVLQNILFLIGYEQFTMLHSNLPLQVEYVLPEFIYPIYRVSGFFNESSQLLIFLVLSLIFLESIDKNTTKKLKYLLSLLSGSKTGALYLISFALFSNIYTILAGVATIVFVGSYLLEEQPRWFVLSNLALEQRLDGLFQSFETVKNPLIGSSFREIIGLDFISIYYVSLGWIGLAILSSYVLYAIFLSRQYLFLILLPISLMANGALPSVQYILFFASCWVLFESKIKTKRS
jgi:hypothetical protein